MYYLSIQIMATTTRSTTRPQRCTSRALQRSGGFTKLQEIDGKGVGLVAATAIIEHGVVLTMANPIRFASLATAQKYLCDTYAPLKELFKLCIRSQRPEEFCDLIFQVGFTIHQYYIVDDSFDFTREHPYPLWYYLNSSTHRMPEGQQHLMAQLRNPDCTLKARVVNHDWFGQTVDWVATRDIEADEELCWSYFTGTDFARDQLAGMVDLKI